MAVHPELEALMAADEEARARVASAERQARAVDDEARAADERRKAELEERAHRELEDAIERIGAEALAGAAKRRERREAWRRERQASAEALLPEAALLWASIVLEGPP